MWILPLWKQQVNFLLNCCKGYFVAYTDMDGGECQSAGRTIHTISFISEYAECEQDKKEYHSDSEEYQ